MNSFIADKPQTQALIKTLRDAGHTVEGNARGGYSAEEQRECSHCNGFGSSLKEDADRCTQCHGTGLKNVTLFRAMPGRSGYLCRLHSSMTEDK